MDNIGKLVYEARFYAPFPDALGRAARAFISAAGGTPPERGVYRPTFDRTQDPERLANWANALEAYEDDPVLGPSVRQVFAVVDTILLPGDLFEPVESVE